MIQTYSTLGNLIDTCLTAYEACEASSQSKASILPCMRFLDPVISIGFYDHFIDQWMSVFDHDTASLCVIGSVGKVPDNCQLRDNWVAVNDCSR